MKAEDFYDEAYFSRQNSGGDLQGRINLFKFSPFLRPGQRVLDFGCGSGALLRAIAGAERSLVGVEINPIAVKTAQAAGLEVVTTLDEIRDETVDMVISNHALEHTENPLAIMRQLRRVLRPGGRLVLVVPCDQARFAFCLNDPDLHLFSWSAGNIGNCARVAGFEVERAEEIVHRWPPKWKLIYQTSGEPAFHVISRLWGRISRSRSQVRVVARKPEREDCP